MPGTLPRFQKIQLWEEVPSSPPPPRLGAHSGVLSSLCAVPISHACSMSRPSSPIFGVVHIMKPLVMPFSPSSYLGPDVAVRRNGIMPQTKFQIRTQ
jgi:hypothetical protein